MNIKAITYLLYIVLEINLTKLNKWDKLLLTNKNKYLNNEINHNINNNIIRNIKAYHLLFYIISILTIITIIIFIKKLSDSNNKISNNKNIIKNIITNYQDITLKENKKCIYTSYNDDVLNIKFIKNPLYKVKGNIELSYKDLILITKEKIKNEITEEENKLLKYKENNKKILNKLLKKS